MLNNRGINIEVEAKNWKVLQYIYLIDTFIFVGDALKSVQ